MRDQGQWRTPRGVHRGRGLPLMHALMDSVGFTHSDAGTTVVLRRTMGKAGP